MSGGERGENKGPRIILNEWNNFYQNGAHITYDPGTMT